MPPLVFCARDVWDGGVGQQKATRGCHASFAAPAGRDSGRMRQLDGSARLAAAARFGGRALWGVRGSHRKLVVA
eukprot:5051688-Prymnesium_polylepis.3